ncbi:unnamed protein product [marine sediment metagenome]|uniref:Uncharacterized protein n=1 Tax=marine sediment metagenome TaxID=412755 RepID=X1HBH7_9ZZZZ
MATSLPLKRVAHSTRSLRQTQGRPLAQDKGRPEPQPQRLGASGAGGAGFGKGSFEGTGTPKGSNVKQGPFDSLRFAPFDFAALAQDKQDKGWPEGLQRQTRRNRKTESSVVFPEFPGFSRNLPARV